MQFLNRRISYLDLQWKSFFACASGSIDVECSAKKIGTESGIKLLKFNKIKNLRINSEVFSEYFQFL